MFHKGERARKFQGPDSLRYRRAYRRPEKCRSAGQDLRGSMEYLNCVREDP
jgi:hypothetical protein